MKKKKESRKAKLKNKRLNAKEKNKSVENRNFDLSRLKQILELKK